jgi:hypothetical protein
MKVGSLSRVIAFGWSTFSHGSLPKLKNADIGTYLLKKDSKSYRSLPLMDWSTGEQMPRLVMVYLPIAINPNHRIIELQGINSTRRFLCEWQSFLYRYIPVGILECVPQKINQRPQPFVGRNDLETLMASPNAKDWIKLT